MSRLKHMMTGTVDKVPFASGEIPPEKEHDAVTIIGYAFDNRVSELFPSYLAVRSRFSASDSKDRIQEQHTLAGPFLQIRITAHPYA